MILYFTGTGNSKFVADFIAEHLEDQCISLNHMIKNDLPLLFQSEQPFIIIAPIYAWRFPKIIEDMVSKAEFVGSKDIYFVGTMESESGNCDKYLEKLCKQKHLEFKGFQGVAMPNNYVVASKMPTDVETRKTLSEAIPVLQGIVEKIKSGGNLMKMDKTRFAPVMSGLVNILFNRFMVSSKNFVVSDQCISCGKCKEACAVNNIKLIDGNPQFGAACINCYACIHRCPVEAINIKGKTEDHGRYVCPDYGKWKERI